MLLQESILVFNSYVLKDHYCIVIKKTLSVQMVSEISFLVL